MTTPTAAVATADVVLFFERLLVTTRNEVELVLAQVPQNLLEARRMITGELRYKPEAEALQTIVKLVANGRFETELQTLSRRRLTLRVLAERELRAFWGPANEDDEPTGADSEIYASILGEARRVDRSFETALGQAEGWNSVERDLLQTARRAFALPLDRVEASALLAPWLDRLTEAAREGELSSIAPSLTDRDAGLLVEDSDDPLRDDRVRAIALKTLIEADLDAAESRREEVRADLEADKRAYLVLTDHLQRRHDDALLGGDGEHAAEIATIRGGVFAIYRKLAATLTGAPDESTDADEMKTFQEKIDAADQEAETVRASAVDRDEVYLDALNDIRDQRVRPAEPAGAEDLRRERNRRRVMTGISAALMLVATVVYVVRPDKPAPIRVEPGEFSSAVALSETKPVGTMLYARAVGWEQIPAADRLERVASLGGFANSKGFSAVYLVDSTGEPVARWTRDGGAELMQAERTTR